MYDLLYDRELFLDPLLNFFFQHKIILWYTAHFCVTHYCLLWQPAHLREMGGRSQGKLWMWEDLDQVLQDLTNLQGGEMPSAGTLRERRAWGKHCMCERGGCELVSHGSSLLLAMVPNSLSRPAARDAIGLRWESYRLLLLCSEPPNEKAACSPRNNNGQWCDEI